MTGGVLEVVAKAMKTSSAEFRFDSILKVFTDFSLLLVL